MSDKNGSWISGFFGSSGHTTNINARLDAIRQELLTVAGLQNIKVELEFDSLETICLTREENTTTNPYGVITKDIKC